MSTNEIAVRTMTELAIEPEQLGFTDAQVAALKQLGVENAPQGELDLFFHTAKRTGLDPFSKQLYMIAREVNVKGPNNEWRKETRYTIQTGIDGFRVHGHRTARQRGDVVTIDSPQWRGRESDWDDVWFDEKNPPLAARFTIKVNEQTYTAVAMYFEYVQTKSNGAPNSMWSKMPANQLAKCAEAAAWRKAYPNDFSGIILEDAAQNITVDAEAEPAARMKRSPRGGNAGLKAALANKAEIASKPSAEPEAAQVEATEPTDKAQDAGEHMAAPEQLRKLGNLLDVEKLATVEEKLTYLSNSFHREITDARQLTYAEAAELTEYLAAEQAKEAGE